MKKRLLAMLLCVAMLLSLCTGFASAASSTIEGALGEVNIFNGGYKLTYLSMNGIARTQSYTYFNYTAASGVVKEIPAYCINPNTAGVPQSVAEGESIKYIANEASNDPKIVGIISNGYPHRSLAELKLDNKYQAYYATKMALWCYLLDNWDISRLTVNPSLSGLELERAQKILTAAKDIYQRGIWWTSVPQPTITVTPDKDSAYAVTIDGKEYKQQIFTAHSETWVCDYDISIGFTLPDEVPEGTRIVNMANEDITKITTRATGSGYAGQFKVLYPADTVDGQSGAVQLSLRANVYKYAIYYALCAETSKYGTLQRYMCDTDPTTEMRQSTFSRYSATPTETPDEPDMPTETTLIIKKVETGTNTALSGALFEVKAPDGTVLGSFATDNSGRITVPLTLSGQYVITEKSAPKWHLLGNDTTKTVMQPLANAKFKVSLVGGTFSKEYVTDQNGEIDLTALTPGAYTVEEITAPTGYLIDEGTRVIQINAGENARFVFTNTPKPVLSVVKYDAENNKYLPGATFRIAKIADGSHYLDRVTDTNGRISIADLEPGVYSVQEIAAPGGYVLNDTEYHVQLFPGKDSTLVVNNEKKPDLKIVKTDATTGNPIEGVTFTVNKADSSTLTTVKTDANGEALLTALDPGVYVVTEKSVPSGYLLDATPQMITLVPNTTGTVRFQNYPKPTLTVNKVDSITKDPIKGAKFHITYASNNTFSGEINDLGTYFTDENGQIQLSKLTDGWYRVTEVEPAAGYSIKDPATQECYIQAGTGKVLTFENVPLSALVIKKVDADSGAVLQGAKFRVRYLGGTSGTGGTIIGEYTTSVNGTVVITGLKAGTYIVEETKAPAGYEIDETPQTVYLSGKDQDVVTVEFSNGKHGGLIVQKIDSVTKQPLSGAQFQITTSSGAFVDNYGGMVSSNGIYTTDSNGQIRLVDLTPGTYVVTETKAPDGYILDTTAQTVAVNQNDTQTLTFTNTPIGGGQIIKVDADSGKRIKGVQFEIAKMNGERIGTYTTDSTGVITLPQLADGWYTATELKAADGYLLDTTPHHFEVKAGKTTSLTIENTKASSILIHKIDSETGKGIYGVTFLVSDRYGNPVGQYTSDQNGYVYIDKELTDGKYLVREIEAADGYLLDTTVRTFYVEYGATSTITWKNTPVMGQIQITKKSADDNPINGLSAGTLLPGATFEIYNRAGNLVDTVVTGSNGVAISDTLPLGRYTIRETKAPSYYSATAQTIDAEIEFSGQIVRLEVLNSSVYTNVSVTKRGYTQVVPGQTIRYDFKNIANNSTVSLNSFYWRDTLPTDAARLQKIVTGTWNQRLSYKVVFKTNLHDYRTLADNLSTYKNNVLDASATALGLASNEYITEYMFVFGTVKSGFAQVDAPYIFCKVNSWLTSGYQFTNKTDVGGLWNGQWIMAADRWVTTVYGKTTTTLPKTGY